MTTTNAIQAPENQASQPGNRPIVEALEKYRGDILNTITSNSGTQRTSAQNSLEFLNALNSLVAPNAGANNVAFANILRGMGITNYANTIAQLRREIAGNTPNIRFEDLPGHNDVQLIITALAEYRRHQSQEQQNQFDAIYLGQTNETNSSTSQQIEAAAQRARLTGHGLYYRNGKALRISYNTTSNQFEAQIIEPSGQISNLQAITATNSSDLVTQIQAQSQAVKNTTAETVQQGVEEREIIDYQQVAAALEFINRGQTQAERESRTGFYSFDKTRFAIRGHGAGDFSVDTQNKDGTITPHTPVAQNAVANIIRTNSHKFKEKKDDIEVLDMGTEFSEATFRKLCREVSNSKDLVGEYKINGKTYIVRQTQPATTTPLQLARYEVQYPNQAGNKVTYPAVPALAGQVGEIGDIVAFLSQNIKTIGNEGNCTRDMGNEFSANTFRDLCEEVTKSRNGRGNYKLAGKNYEIRADMPIPTDITQTEFHVDHPNDYGITIHSHGTLDVLLLNNGPMSHIHAHDPSKPAPFERETMIRLCDEAWSNSNQKIPFDFHGATCRVYRGSGLESGKYCVDVPNNKGGMDTVRAITAKGLYDKFIEHTNKLHHAAEKPAEGATKPEGAEPKDAAHAEDHGHSHTKTEGTFYDRSVEKIFGHGLIGRAFIGTKNLIPTPIRKISGNAAAAGVRAGLVGGILYGGSIALGSAAMASAIVPAMGITFATSSTLRLIKWWRNRGKTEDGGGHGGH